MSQTDTNESIDAGKTGAPSKPAPQSTSAQAPLPAYERPKTTAMPGTPERTDRGMGK